MTQQAKRERSQLVIALGEDEAGQRMRDLFDQAAEKSGQKVSAWARDILLAAVGQPSVLERLARLEESMSWLEKRIGGRI
jgi:hypothetical protein